jgi:glycosyltransferase involved in cell wall biosynthesis
MKIFVISPGIYFDGITGDSVHLSNLWNAISNIAEVDDIHIFCSIEKKKPIKKNNIKFHHSFFVRSKVSIITASSLFVTILLTFLKIVFNLIVSKPDLIYSRHQMLNVFLFLKYFTKPPKNVLEVNGFFSEEIKIQNLPFKNFFSYLLYKLELKSFKKADKIISVSNLMKQRLIEKFNVNKNKIYVITNGVDTKLFYPKAKMTKDLHLSRNLNYVCFVGNLVPWQGIKYIIYAAEQTKANYPNLHYIIIGDGILRDDFFELSKSLAVDNFVHFIGTVSHDLVADYINISKICLAPFVLNRNKNVGFSAIKIFEYLACGKPVITSNIPGNNLEFIEENKFGVLVNPKNLKSLSNEIIGLLNNDDIMNKTKEFAPNLINQEYSWYNIAKKIYYEVLK